MRTLRNAMKLFGVILLVSLLVIGTTACGTNRLEKRLAGSWYEEEDFDPDDRPALTFFEDGTVKIAHVHGTGTWCILGDDTLKITDYYGEVDVAHIQHIDTHHMTLDDGSGEVISEFWKAP